MKMIAWTLTALIPLSVAFADGKKTLMCSDVTKEEFTKKTEKHHDKFLKKLKLSKDQEKQMKQIHQNHAEKIYAQVQKVRGAHTQLMGTAEKNGSADELRTSFKALEAEKQALMAAKFEEMLEIREALSPDQRQKAVAEMKDKMADKCD